MFLPTARAGLSLVADKHLTEVAADHHRPYVLGSFLASAGILIFGLPFIIIPVPALLSKLVPEEAQVRALTIVGTQRLAEHSSRVKAFCIWNRIDCRPSLGIYGTEAGLFP